jgi:hypothetical protein
MENKLSFLNYLQSSDPNFLKEGLRDYIPGKRDIIRSIPLTAAILGGNYLSGDPLGSFVKKSPSEDIRPEEIISKKTVIPKEIIRNSQINPLKWDKDFEELEKPGEKDIGFATHKDYFSKPIELYVLDDKTIKRISPKSIAFAEKNKVFLSSKLFDVLPSKSSDGKLNAFGRFALAHELRHTTQSMSPLNRSQDNTKYNWYQKYMQDPNEMGVRIAAVKNIMDKDTIKNVLKNIEKSNFKKQVVMNTIPKDEETLFMYFFEPDIWADLMAQEHMRLQGFDMNYKSYYRDLIKSIKNQLALINEDVKTLFDFYEKLSDKDKKTYLKELLGAYNQVVQNAPSNKKIV